MQPEEIDVLPPEETAIVDYLSANPDFFTRHPGLLSELNLPHASGKAVSLIEHQVGILRERNVAMRRRMHELLQAARDNDGLFSKTRSLTLALLEADSLQALNEVLATYVLVDFEADFVCCHLVTTGNSLDHMVYHDDSLPFAHLLPNGTAQCATLREEELELLFPIPQHDTSGSVVMLPLVTRAGEGALCIGSRDPQRFTKEMDTLFVAYIADVLSKVIDKLR